MRTLMMIMLGVLLCACSSGPVRVHGADVSLDGTRVRVYDDRYYGRGYYYDDDYDRHRHPGSFCPPGQAKKGRC